MTSVTASTKYQKLYKSIKDILQCPVCYLTPKRSEKIEVCINGHYICESCCSKVTTCPVCRSNKLNFPSPLLKRLLESLPMSCSYASFGCQDTFDEEHDLEEHKTKCGYRTVKCVQIRCKEKIFFKDLLSHLKEKHKSKGGTIVKLIISDEEVKPNLNQVRDWSTSHHKFDDQVFFVTYHIKKEGALEIQSLIWGPPALARNYIYKISIRNEEDSNYAINATGDVISVDDYNVEEQENWFHPGCFIMNPGMIKQYSNPENKRLTIRFEFEKRKLKKNPGNLSLLNNLTDFDPVTDRLSQLDLTRTFIDTNNLANANRFMGRQSSIRRREVQEPIFRDNWDSEDELDQFDSTLYS